MPLNVGHLPTKAPGVSSPDFRASSGSLVTCCSWRHDVCLGHCCPRRSRTGGPRWWPGGRQGCNLALFKHSKDLVLTLVCSLWVITRFSVTFHSCKPWLEIREERERTSERAWGVHGLLLLLLLARVEGIFPRSFKINCTANARAAQILQFSGQNKARGAIRLISQLQRKLPSFSFFSVFFLFLEECKYVLQKANKQG